MQNLTALLKEKFSVSLSYSPGETPSFATAMLAINKRADGLRDFVHALYGDKWIVDDGVRLIQGSLPDAEIQNLLTYQLMSRLPPNYLRQGLRTKSRDLFLGQLARFSDN